MNPATACAEVLVDEMVRHGVREAVLCPGSRSAPLAFALHAADQAGRLRLHVRTDERSAAFLALGLAKATGVAVPVVTTSGTAVANLHPAVLEASHSGVPLLLLTADRPPELRGSGANQTTEQVGIFGSAVRLQRDLGTPDARPGQVAHWRSTISRTLTAARGSAATPPGPVHLNVPLREPLVPDGGAEAAELAAALDAGLDGRPDGAPWTATVTRSTVAQPIPDDERRTLVVVGDLPATQTADLDWGRAAADLAASRGWPLIAEPSSAAAFGASLPHGSLLLGCAPWLARHRPERVVVVGRVTLSRPVAQLLADPGASVDLVTAPGPWPDPAARARAVYPLESLLADDTGASPPRDASWQDAWRSASAAAAAAVVVEASWPSGPAIARTTLAGLPSGAQLFVGSSNPVRDLDVGAGRRPDVRVIANRGLAGIDGCISTAAGIALASAAPTYALLGDLTFLHDLGGLVIGPHEPQPNLTIVVVNDDGGGIFTLLEPGEPEHAASFDRVFAAPHGRDLGLLCKGMGVAHVHPRDSGELATALSVAPQGIRVAEVTVPRGSHRERHRELRRAVEQVLADLG